MSRYKEATIAGPCQSCGRKNYHLSTSGPGYCPSCACSPPSRRQIREFEEAANNELTSLREQNRVLKEKIETWNKAAEEILSLEVFAPFSPGTGKHFWIPQKVVERILRAALADEPKT